MKNHYFRALAVSDLSSINDIAKDIWDGHDYMSDVAPRWIQNPDGCFYGLFREGSPDELVAFERVVIRNDDFAWLEGGRVRASCQKQGYGIELTRFGINYAQKEGCKKVQFATHSENTGTLRIAPKFGFNQLAKMIMLSIAWEDFQVSKYAQGSCEPLRVLSLAEVLELYPNIPAKGISLDGINFGWSFLPLQQPLLDKYGLHSYWVADQSGTALLRAEQIHQKPSESPIDEWITLYGTSQACLTLLNSYLQSKKDTHRLSKITVLVSELENISDFLSHGFQYTENKESCVFLFEKDL